MLRDDRGRRVPGQRRASPGRRTAISRRRRRAGSCPPGRGTRETRRIRRCRGVRRWRRRSKRHRARCDRRWRRRPMRRCRGRQRPTVACPSMVSTIDRPGSEGIVAMSNSPIANAAAAAGSRCGRLPHPTRAPSANGDDMTPRAGVVGRMLVMSSPPQIVGTTLASRRAEFRDPTSSHAMRTSTELSTEGVREFTSCSRELRGNMGRCRQHPIDDPSSRDADRSGP